MPEKKIEGAAVHLVPAVPQQAKYLGSYRAKLFGFAVMNQTPMTTTMRNVLHPYIHVLHPDGMKQLLCYTAAFCSMDAWGFDLSTYLEAFVPPRQIVVVVGIHRLLPSPRPIPNTTYSEERFGIKRQPRDIVFVHSRAL